MLSTRFTCTAAAATAALPPFQQRPIAIASLCQPGSGTARRLMLYCRMSIYPLPTNLRRIGSEVCGSSKFPVRSPLFYQNNLLPDRRSIDDVPDPDTSWPYTPRSIRLKITGNNSLQALRKTVHCSNGVSVLYNMQLLINTNWCHRMCELVGANRNLYNC